MRCPRAFPPHAAPLIARLFASVPPDVKTTSRASAWSPWATRSCASSRPARAARPSAWADDGTLEAMEDPGASFRVGVQWHPEVGTDPRLFHALVAAAIRSAD